MRDHQWCMANCPVEVGAGSEAGGRCENGPCEGDWSRGRRPNQSAERRLGAGTVNNQ